MLSIEAVDAFSLLHTVKKKEKEKELWTTNSMFPSMEEITSSQLSPSSFPRVRLKQS